MQGQGDQPREKEERLRALGLRGEPQRFDAECMHCGGPFNSWSGHVSAEASLWDFCLHGD